MKCWKCDHEQNRQDTILDGPRQPEGTLTVCAYCGALARRLGDGQRPLSKEEHERVMDCPALRRAIFEQRMLLKV